jgi:hypothetical protein
MVRGRADRSRLEANREGPRSRFRRRFAPAAAPCVDRGAASPAARAASLVY